jgi:hypothetical protein
MKSTKEEIELFNWVSSLLNTPNAWELTREDDNELQYVRSRFCEDGLLAVDPLRMANVWVGLYKDNTITTGVRFEGWRGFVLCWKAQRVAYLHRQRIKKAQEFRKALGRKDRINQLVAWVRNFDRGVVE